MSANKLKEMPLAGHLRELKRRLMLSLAFFAAALLFAALNIDALFQLVAGPILRSSSVHHLITTSVTEGFDITLNLVLSYAVFLSFPFWLWQLYLFIRAALEESEKALIRTCFCLSPVLFYAGTIFLVYVAFPPLLRFFIGFNTDFAAGALQLLPKMSEYLNLLLNLGLVFGLAFQLPIVVIIMVRFGVVNVETLTKNRKYAVVLIFVVAAILTPPDVLSQIMLALPLLILYELSIMLSKILNKDNARYQVNTQ